MPASVVPRRCAYWSDSRTDRSKTGIVTWLALWLSKVATLQWDAGQLARKSTIHLSELREHFARMAGGCQRTAAVPVSQPLVDGTMSSYLWYLSNGSAIG